MHLINNMLDLCAIVICLTLFFYLLADLGWKDRLNRTYLLMCAFNLLMAAGSMLRRNFQGLDQAWHPFLLRLGTAMNFLFSTPLLIIFAYYVIQYLSPRVAVNQNVRRTFIVLGVVQLGLCVVSLFADVFYVIDAQNIYHRGPLYWLSQPIPIALHLMQAGLILAYRKFLRARDVFFLSSYVVLPLSAGIAHIFFGRLSLPHIGFTLSLVLIFLSIQYDWRFYVDGRKGWRWPKKYR